MKSRRILLWLGALLLVANGAAAADPSAARALYREYRAAHSAGQRAAAERLAAQLGTYPLYPYIRYDALRGRLHQLPSVEVAEVLARYPASFIGERLRTEWLRELARQKRWDLFRRDYRAQDDLALRCHELTARLAGGAGDALLEATLDLWLRGDSLPPACDPAFARLEVSALMTDDLVWQRMGLALGNGKAALARYLARRLQTVEAIALAELWLRAHDDPAQALSARPADSARAREVMVYALTRLAARDVDRARTAWTTVAPRFAFSPTARGTVAAAFATAAAGTQHPERIALLDAVPGPSVDVTVERYRLREGIATGAWAALARWSESPPQAADEALRWRYWRGRALAALGEADAARAVFAELARERDYYGFLAADRIGQPYAFNDVPVAATAAETAAFLARPALARVREFRALGLLFEARREWHFELAPLERRELEVAASIAANWDWPERAIFALGQAQSYDDLSLRFPLVYRELALDYAHRRAIQPARIFAIIRNESAFAVDARSPVGALGLMQVMPATGRETARRIGLEFTRSALLLQPRENIAIGSAYLQQMLARFDGNFAMAAAAYNAGPHRVRQWQGAACVAADRWIDAIPFTETRSYVRRALFYVAVYERRLGQAITRLESIMSPIPARGTSGTTDCTS